MGEAYIEGWWDCHNLDEFFHKVLSADLEKKIVTRGIIFDALKARLFNMQSKWRSHQVAHKHYDIGNDFYQAMLDPWMQYTCAYWNRAGDLNQAQEHKLDLICQKLQLRPGEKLLDLGCGWGGLAKFAAERYEVEVTAVNISQQQVNYARESCKGLPVTIHQLDYRDTQGVYDKVASIGLCEHIGYKNYRRLMNIAAARLKPGGLFLLHTIGRNISTNRTDLWIGKYIFPNGMLPSARQLTTAFEGVFVLEDWHSFGPDYDATLMAWYANFERNWPRFRDRYGEQFYRMWRYYLLSCAGAFRARKIQLWQLILSPNGVAGGYKSIR